MGAGDGSEVDWLGRPVDEGRLEVDHYHGEFKRGLDCGCGH